MHQMLSADQCLVSSGDVVSDCIGVCSNADSGEQAVGSAVFLDAHSVYFLTKNLHLQRWSTDVSINLTLIHTIITSTIQCVTNCKQDYFAN